MCIGILPDNIHVKLCCHGDTHCRYIDECAIFSWSVFVRKTEKCFSNLVNNYNTDWPSWMFQIWVSAVGCLVTKNWYGVSHSYKQIYLVTKTKFSQKIKFSLFEILLRHNGKLAVVRWYFPGMGWVLACYWWQQTIPSKDVVIVMHQNHKIVKSKSSWVVLAGTQSIKSGYFINLE